jgi:phospholipid/cholesterol/gamma-HCH transport system substrate-binding protein
MRRRLRAQTRRSCRAAACVLALATVGTVACFYILLKERLPNPLDGHYALSAAFPSAAGVAPGLGEPVDVAGVHVGQITGASLKDGQAIIQMAIDPGALPRLYGDASAQLVPNTPLQDMQVNISPGDPAAGVLPRGATIRAAQTTSPVQSDELLASLDTDTRTWLTSLISQVDAGIAGRSRDLRALFANLTPTATQLHELTSMVAARRHEVAAIVHNLGVVASAAGTKDTQLRAVVEAGARTLQALAGRDVALRTSVAQLPATLQSAARTLTDVGTLGAALRPTATILLPAAHELPSTLRDARTLFDSRTLLPLQQLRPFTAALEPAAQRLPAITSALRSAIPPLRSSLDVLKYTTNELAYNGGPAPGFLYWLAWAAHNADSLVSTGDAHGAVIRGMGLISCGALKGSAVGALLGALLDLKAPC